MAQWERETIGERTRDALRFKITKGERCGRVRFGYDLAGDRVNLVPNEGEQRTIALMHEPRSAGHSYRSIAAELNAKGIGTKDGRPVGAHDRRRDLDEGGGLRDAGSKQGDDAMATSKLIDDGGNAQHAPTRRKRFRTWGKRLLWLLPALLAVYGLLKVADWIWYRTQLPTTFRNANWSGKWETHRYWGLSGNLIVRLPEPLPQNEDFKADALVYYPIYSVWKTGQFVKMEFHGQFSPDSPTSAGRSTNTIPSGGGKLKFKGKFGNQVVEYAAIIDESRTCIVGGYLSTFPSDFGSFQITNP